jgi:hypothetical protein
LQRRLRRWRLACLDRFGIDCGPSVGGDDIRPAGRGTHASRVIALKSNSAVRAPA